MNKKYISLGLFLVISLGLLFWLAREIGALGGKDGNHYEVRLDHAAGLVKDNAVKIAGVKVGEIEKVSVDHKTAVLTLRIDPDVELHTDAEALVRAKSLLGEKYLQLDPGSLDAPLLEDGAEIEKVATTFEIDQVLNALQPILGGEDSIGAVLQPLITRFDTLMASAMGDEDNDPVVTKERIKEDIKNIEDSIASAKRIIENAEAPLNELLDNGNKVLGDPRIPRIIGNLDKITRTTAEHLPTLMTKAENALDAVDNLAKEITPERAENIGKTLDDVAVATANLRKISEDLKGLGKDVGDLVSSLSLISKRAASIDELTIREFIQGEGMRVNLKTPKEVKKKIDALKKGK